MAAMSLSNLHPDLRLGLLLVVAALLLDAGSSGTLWATHGLTQLELSDAQGGLLTAAFGLGSLFVVAGAVWVDRHPPHGMMAAGALVLALGLALLNISDGFGPAIAGMFLAGAGGAFVGYLIFYAVAVKGYRRYKGALLGALALAFGVRLEDWAFAVGWGGWASVGEGTGLSIWWWVVCLVLAAGGLLFLLCPAVSRALTDRG